MYLGTLFLLKEGLVKPTEERAIKLYQVVNAIIKGQSQAKDFLHLLGVIASCIEIIPNARLYMRPIQLHLLSFWKPASLDLVKTIPITQHLIDYLQWWLNPENVLKGKYKNQKELSETITTDASKTDHNARLDNLLASNGLERKRIYPDGNCFLRAVLTQISDPQNNLDAPKLRQDIVNHLRENHEHYINVLSFRSDDDEISNRDIYEDTINDIQQDGHWNVELADCMPLAVSNIFKRTIRIFSSRISNQVYDIKPDL